MEYGQDRHSEPTEGSSSAGSDDARALSTERSDDLGTTGIPQLDEVADFQRAHEYTSGRRTLSELFGSLNAFWTIGGLIFLFTAAMMMSGRFDSIAKDLMRFLGPESTESASAAETEMAEDAVVAASAYSFLDLDIHPDLLLRTYMSAPTSEASSARAAMIHQFRELLALYEERQAVDDNFTIRVVDNRNNRLLELYEFHRQREAYENREPGQLWNWGRVDELRRTATRTLVDKHAERGVPRGAITVKWGRLNQVLEARERENAYIEYEIRLARKLGFSLLVTEIGTVETFNEDRLVSSVGARSRYQMMPYLLRQYGIRQYRIATAAGNAVDVREEWHPLLTMEPAFTVAAGYRNAVGHEIPGLSSYHTGPGNIFMLYRMFLAEATELYEPTSTVVDAFMWAVTKGFDSVSRNSSFKTYSRGYVPAIYGSLRATESLPIDSTRTLHTELVQVRAGQQILLSDLLRILGAHGDHLQWGTDEADAYERYRALNPHFALPAAEGTSGSVSPRADLRLTATAQNGPVRFFLPLGATDVLKSAGVDVLDESRTVVFDHDTYRAPRPSEVTVWDRQYQYLIDDVAGFGFTNENRRRLNFLVNRFQALADANPSPYRLLQLEVIRTHQRIWNTGVFDRLANVVSAARGRLHFDTLPPSELPTSTRPRLNSRMTGPAG